MLSEIVSNVHSPLPKSYQSALSTDISHFSPYNVEDTRNVAALKVLRVGSEVSPTFLSLEHFKVCFLNRDGTHVQQPVVYTFERKQKDKVLDLLPFTFIGGTLYVAITQCLRPSLAARNLMSSPDPIPEHGLHWCLPGAYYSSHEPLESQIKKVLSERVGLPAARPPFSLGGGYYPSIGSSTEFCVPYAVEIMPGRDFPLVRYGSNFEGMRLTNLAPAQDIIDGYLSGRIRDSRLVFCVFRLCEMLNYPLSVPLELPEQHVTPLSMKTQKRFFSLDQLRTPLALTTREHATVERLTVTPCRPPELPFLRHERVLVENHSIEGRILHWYEADLCARKGVDSVDIGCFFRKDKSTFMAIKCGIRPILAAYPNSESRHGKTDPAFELSGVAESLEGETTTEEIRERALQGVREELGLEPQAGALFLGCSYPSPGTNPERVYSYLCPVDPQEKAIDTHPSLDETAGSGFARVEDIIRLGREAYITDHRYLLTAYFLKHASERKSSLKH